MSIYKHYRRSRFTKQFLANGHWCWIHLQLVEGTAYHFAASPPPDTTNVLTAAGWITLIFGFALWPLALIWAYVDGPARKTEQPR